MIALNLPLITWIVIAVFVVLFVIISLCYKKGWWRKGSKRHHNFVEIASQQDEFYVPGDPLPGDDKK